MTAYIRYDPSERLAKAVRVPGCDNMARAREQPRIARIRGNRHESEAPGSGHEPSSPGFTAGGGDPARKAMRPGSASESVRGIPLREDGLREWSRLGKLRDESIVKAVQRAVTGGHMDHGSRSTGIGLVWSGSPDCHAGGRRLRGSAPRADLARCLDSPTCFSRELYSFSCGRPSSPTGASGGVSDRVDCLDRRSGPGTAVRKAAGAGWPVVWSSVSRWSRPDHGRVCLGGLADVVGVVQA